jgi:alpha-glucosidase (family GH31 glycosyl hydrolase)
MGDLGFRSAAMHRYTFAVNPVANPDAVVGGDGRYRFTLLTDGLLRYEWAIDSRFEDRASVLAVNRNLPVPEFRVKDQNGSLEIITSRFHLTYDKRQFSPSGLTASIKGAFNPHGSLWRYGKDAENLGGTARTLDEADGAVPVGLGIVSRSGFATLDDSRSILFDKTETHFVGTRPAGDRVDGYLFAYGKDYRAAVKAFYTLSGYQPLLPRWALGNWWSRYHAYSTDEYLALMDQFRDKGIPLSVAVIDMDWHLVDDPRIAEEGVTGWTGYTWNKELFPDPGGFLEQLHGRNLITSLNDHPADGIHSYEEPYEDMARALDHDTSMGDPIHFNITDRRFLDAYFDILHRRFEDQGVDLWWVDWQQGEHSRVAGVDPLWLLNHFHFMDSSRDRKRPLAFSRYAGPGSHRYPVGFSGDTTVTWGSLHFQPEFTAMASNIGYGWWSHDIGGHFHGYRDDELLIRWVQFGTFSPILRLHSSNNPWNIKEPWLLEIGKEVIMTDYLRLRHRMVPYLYSMNVRSALDGEPLVQPMYWAYPTCNEAYHTPNQYLYGSELIVAPITTPQDPKLRLGRARAWLPAGRYVDIFSGAVYDGDRNLWVNRRLADYPVFAREGAIIPLDAAAEPINGCGLPTAFEVLVVLGADGRFEIVEDDGTGSNAEEVQFVRIPITFRQQDGTVQIGPSQGSSSTSDVRDWNIRLLGYFEPPEPVRITINKMEKEADIERVSNGSLIHVGTYPEDATIVLHLEPTPQLTPTRPAPLILEFLRHVQMELDMKEKIWAIIEAKVPRTVQVSRLHALDLDPSLLHALLEYLLADSRGDTFK